MTHNISGADCAGVNYEFMRSNLLFAAFTILLAAGVFETPSVFSQSQKTIEWPKVSIYNSKTATTPENHITDQIDQIEIESVIVEGQPITFGEPFSASDDWLRNIGFRVKNVSGKPLRVIQIILVLPELIHGPQIQYDCNECRLGGAKNPIAVATEVDLTMPNGGLYPWVKGRIAEQRSLSSISKAQILIAFVKLADGTVWSSDCVKTADSRNACPRRGQ